MFSSNMLTQLLFIFYFYFKEINFWFRRIVAVVHLYTIQIYSFLLIELTNSLNSRWCQVSYYEDRKMALMFISVL